jgi:hypothetical protein
MIKKTYVFSAARSERGADMPLAVSRNQLTLSDSVNTTRLTGKNKYFTVKKYDPRLFLFHSRKSGKRLYWSVFHIIIKAISS